MVRPSHDPGSHSHGQLSQPPRSAHQTWLETVVVLAQFARPPAAGTVRRQSCQLAQYSSWVCSLEVVVRDKAVNVQPASYVASDDLDASATICFTDSDCVDALGRINWGQEYSV